VAEHSPGVVFGVCTIPIQPFIGSAANPKASSAPLRCSHSSFTEDARDADFAVIVRAIDWGRVRWELEEFSGVALRYVRVNRSFQYALDEARERTAQFGSSR
jgi:hypothetical protein